MKYLNAIPLALLGFGTGSMVRYFHQECPFVARIDVVELSPKVVDMAQRFFGLKRDNRLHMHTMDGYTWLQSAEDRSYDIIINDASGSQADFLSPFAFRLIKSKLRPDGIYVLNANAWQLFLPLWCRNMLLNLMAPLFVEI